jgi:ABC-type branched-subunit amino acid transport system substrate-binding protein
LCALVIALGAPLTTAAAEPPIDVPVILPLTGGNAFAGSGQRTAPALLQELVNRGGGIHGR